MKEICLAKSFLKENGCIICTARKDGFERSKDNKLMITYKKEEILLIPDVSPILLSLFDHEWIFKVKKFY
jgi:hypothetical protein